MKRIATLIVACVAAMMLWAIAPASAQGSERIRSYDVKIEIEADDSIVITETIEYDFGGSADRHGIFRDVPTRLRYDDRYDRVYPLHVDSVAATGGASADFVVSTEPGGITRIKVGDPDVTITGVHTYRLLYTVQAAMNGFSDHDELYWNAIGGDWDVPIEHATVVVSGPRGFLAAACYAGPVGSYTACDKKGIDGSTTRFAQKGLFPFEAFTVVVSLPKGAVAEPHPLLVEPWSIDRAFSRTPATLGVSGGLLVLLIAGCAWLFWTRGRDRRYVGSPVDQTMGNPTGDSQAVPLFERGVAPVEFAPPEDLRPGQVGTIVDEQANTLDVTATIVDLAVRGYLTIEEIPKEGWFGKPDWTLHRTDKADGDLLAYERTLLTGLFKDGNDPALSSLKRTFSERLTKVEDELYADAVETRVVREASRQGSLVVARAGCAALRRRSDPDVRLREMDDVRARGHPGRGGRVAPHGGRAMDAEQDRERHRDRTPRRRLPDRDRNRGDPRVAVGGGAERLHPVPALCDRVRLHGEVGEGVRRAPTDAPRHDVVPLEPPVHLRGLRPHARRLLGDDRRDDRVDAGLVGLERVLRRRVLGRRWRGRRRWIVVTRSMGRRAHRLL